MKIIVKAKPVKFHITSSEKDCFSLQDLYRYFNLADIKQLIMDDKMSDWLRSLKTDEANRIAGELDTWQKSSAEDAGDVALVQIFFPKEPGESNYAYLLRHKSTNLYDVMWPILYKSDIEIAIHCIENDLVKLSAEISADGQPATAYYLTKTDIESLRKSTADNQQRAKLYFLYGNFLLKFRQSFDMGKSLISQAAEWGFESAKAYLNSQEFATLKQSRNILNTIREKINRGIDTEFFDSSAVKSFIFEFSTWADQTEDRNEYNELIYFIQQIFQIVLTYSKSKETAIHSALKHLEASKSSSAPDYEKCFWGILCLICYNEGKRESKSLFQQSATFPVSEYILKNWEHVNTNKFEYENMKLEYWDPVKKFADFVKSYTNYTINYLIKNEQ